MKTVNECIETLERYGFEDIAGDIIFHLISTDIRMVQLIDDKIKIKEAYLETAIENKDHHRINGYKAEISLLIEIKNKIDDIK